MCGQVGGGGSAGTWWGSVAIGPAGRASAGCLGSRHAWPAARPVRPRRPCRQDGGERADCQGSQVVAQLEGQSPLVNEVAGSWGTVSRLCSGLSGGVRLTWLSTCCVPGSVGRPWRRPRGGPCPISWCRWRHQGLQGDTAASVTHLRVGRAPSSLCMFPRAWGGGHAVCSSLSRWMHVLDAAWMLRPGTGGKCELPRQ